MLIIGSSFSIFSVLIMRCCKLFVQPALFSHANNVESTVASVLGAGVCRALVPRLSTVASQQFDLLTGMLREIELTGAGDIRTLTRCRKKTEGLDVAAFYRLRTWGGVDSPFHDFVWHNHAPSKVQFFAWLLSQSRIALLRKHILTAEEAHCPICDAVEEIANHIFFECTFAQQFWASLGFRFPPDADVRLLYSYNAHADVPRRSTSTFTLLCCWGLWKHRNAVAFGEQRPCLPPLRKNCRDDAALWKARLPEAHVSDAAHWLACLATL
ncbi:unnamed protein product [Alopecurus aequalis]